MVIQIINFSAPDIFKYYYKKYNISEGNYSYGLYGLEIRDLQTETAESLLREISNFNVRFSSIERDNGLKNILVIGSIKRFKRITDKIKNESLNRIKIKLFNTINFFENYELTSYKIDDKLFEFNKAYIMGILNVTPDSFSDGGAFFETQTAINRAVKMLDEGADIIDIGGESSRPGAEPVDAQTEIGRVIPVVKGILRERPGAVISVDTTKSEVAKAVLQEGVKIINDISGLTFDPEMIKTIAGHDAAAVIMHMKGTPKDMQENPTYENVVEEVYDFLYKQCRKASKGGIQKIFVDPGIGFGKRLEDNYNLLRRLDDFKSLSYPILIGVSRKSFIGNTLNLRVEERDVPTAMAESYALSKGARIIRTHNVKYGVQLKELFNKINSATI